MTAIVKFKPRRLHIIALAVSGLLAVCNTVSLWSVGEAPGPLAVTQR